MVGLMLLLAPAQLAAGEQAVLDQGKRDIALILPQLGLGGEETDALTPHKCSTREWKPADGATDPIAATWCIPEGLDKSKKYPLLITFHGDGGNGPQMAQVATRSSSSMDPVIVAGVSWQNAERSLRGGDTAGFVKQVRDMQAAIVAEYPVDPTRVFLQGFSAGCTVAEFVIEHEWKNNRDGFDIRAVFYHSKGFDPRKEYPAIPMIQTVGEKEDNFAGQDQRGYIRRFCNAARKRGLPVTYHEIPGRGHEMAPRVLQIVRDHIQAFGGPGCDLYRTARGAQEPAELLPFATPDALCAEVVALCRAEDFKGAMERAAAIEADKAIAAKDKKELKKLPKEIEKYAKEALPKLAARLDKSMKANQLPADWVVKRMRSMIAAWPDATWVKNRDYASTLEKLETEYEPGKRERERADQFAQVLALESQPEKWAEAKALCETLAARAQEDGGKSPWPGAARYRLVWWTDN